KDRHGKITGKATLAVSEAASAKYFAKQDSRSEGVVEASGNWMFLYETIGLCAPASRYQTHPRRLLAIKMASKIAPTRLIPSKTQYPITSLFLMFASSTASSFSFLLHSRSACNNLCDSRLRGEACIHKRRREP